MNFYKSVVSKFFAVILLCFCIYSPVNAENKTGCDDDNNSYINPTLAICSTHVYNIGNTGNVTTFTERELMNEVVALKTTVVTQQMKKQYDFLEATLRRLKAQLEKSVLQAKLEANGAETSDSKNANNIMQQFENCSAYSLEDAAKCFKRNIDKMQSYINAKNVNKSVLFKKMLTDCKMAASKASDTANECETKCNKDLKNNKESIESCIDILNNEVSKMYDEVEKRKYYNNK